MDSLPYFRGMFQSIVKDLEEKQLERSMGFDRYYTYLQFDTVADSHTVLLVSFQCPTQGRI